jgi:hypothetical protein
MGWLRLEDLAVTFLSPRTVQNEGKSLFLPYCVRV